MSNFTSYDSSLTIQYHPQASRLLGQDYWVVTEPFVYRINTVGGTRYVTVPTGYLTDGASVPRPLWGMIPPWGDHGQAAVLHDYLCEFGYITDGTVNMAITRQQCDLIFLEALQVLGVSAMKTKLIALGINFYRNLMNPKCPNECPLKMQISDAIMHNRRTRDTYLLLNYQMDELKLTINQ